MPYRDCMRVVHPGSSCVRPAAAAPMVVGVVVGDQAAHSRRELLDICLQEDT